MSALDLLRADLRGFTLYTPGDGDDSLVRLHANELPFRASADSSERGLHRYPLGRDARLRARLAGLYGVSPEQLLVTRGSDDGIDLLIRSFCDPGANHIVTTRPGFGMYPALARLQGCATVFVDLDEATDFAVDIRTVTDACTAATKMVFLCSPNNPSGLAMDAADVRIVCETLRDRAVVVVDEAYVEFSTQDSASRLLDTCDNLVVLRTLSKAYGLAGARIGAVIASVEIINTLDQLLTPFPLASPCVDAALLATAPQRVRERRAQWAQIAWQRDGLIDALRDCDDVENVWPSDANFVLCQMKAAREVVARCRDHGLLVRCITGIARDYVRITVGTPEQNQRVLDAIDGAIA